MRITITQAAGVYELPAPGEVALYSTPVQYEVLARETFSASALTLPQVLERAMGTQVQSSGGLGSFSTVSLRGASSEQVLIYLDGVPLNDASGGGFDLGAIDLEQLQRIEIFRGATPLELGGASLGGAINLVTRQADQQTAAHVKTTVGSFATRGLAGGWQQSTGRDGLLLNASALASDNDFEIRNDNGTSFNTDDDFDEPRNNADFEQYHLLGKWRHSFGADAALTVALQAFHKGQGLPDLSNDADTGTRLDTETLRLQNRLDVLRLGDDPRTSASVNLFAVDKQEVFDDRQGQIGLQVQHTRGTTRRVGIDGFVNRNADDTTLRGVIESYRETYTFEDLLQVLADSESQRDAVTLGTEMNHYTLDNRLILSGVLRGQWVRDDLEATDASAGVPPTVEQQSYDLVSPQLGVKYVLNAQSHVKANVGRYARIPAFFELFGDRGFFLGNEELEPETGTNVDIGVQYAWHAPGAWYHQGVVTSEVFYNRAQDLIARVFDAQGVGRSENVSRATIAGLSLAASLQPITALQVDVSATVMDTKIDSELTSFDGNQLPGRFAQSYRLTIAWTAAQWRYALESYLRKEMYFDSANLLPAADQLWSDASI
ncbi:MAG: TonB-dependent receptor, partial [Gammaproteobacteria bacterium]|nr:TonB-dependent receptor [Gammaproteobacteria bacterium]